MEPLEGEELCFPNLLNTSCRRPTAHGAGVIIGTCVTISMSLVMAVLNLLVVISISHFRYPSPPGLSHLDENV